MIILITRDTGVALNDLSWARFSAPRQEILLLPLEENIGLYNFRVQVSAWMSHNWQKKTI